MSEIKKDIAGYAFMGVLSILLIVWIIPQCSPPWQGYGMPPTLMPNIASLFILCLSILGISRIIWRHRSQLFSGKKCEENRQKGIPSWVFLFLVIVPCIIFMPAISIFGFIPTGIVFMAAIQFICGQRKVIPFILVCLVPVLLFWWIMRYALGVPLP